MDEDLIAELKQFIAATFKQSTSDLAKKVDGLAVEIDSRFNAMGKRFDELELKVVTIADAQAEQLKDHELRITRLEQRTA